MSNTNPHHNRKAAPFHHLDCNIYIVILGRLHKTKLHKALVQIRSGFRWGCKRHILLFYFFFAEIVWMFGCLRQNELMHQIVPIDFESYIFLHFWGGISPSDTPCPHKCQSSVSPLLGRPSYKYPVSAPVDSRSKVQFSSFSSPLSLTTL